MRGREEHKMTFMFPAWANGSMLVLHSKKGNAERGENLGQIRAEKR